VRTAGGALKGIRPLAVAHDVISEPKSGLDLRAENVNLVEKDNQVRFLQELVPADVCPYSH
jgi:hypothetical protein